MPESQEEKQLQRDAEHQQQKTLLPHLYWSLARHFDAHTRGLELPIATTSKDGGRLLAGLVGQACALPCHTFAAFDFAAILELPRYPLV